MKLEKILYSTKVTSTGGREGASVSEDKTLSVKLSTPQALGGSGGPGTNPEQMFAGGYAACFLSALNYVAQQQKIKLSTDSSVTAEVAIGPNETGFGLQVTLFIQLNGLEKDIAKELVDKAHVVCPYSNATQNNIDVQLIIED